MGKFKDYLEQKQSEKYKKYLNQKVLEIRERIKSLEKLSDDELKDIAKIIRKANVTDSNIIDSFALTTIVVSRITGMNLYDVQLQGGFALLEGNIAEMKTGEGKTITSSLPTIARALCYNEKVHVVTVNEYLAKRDKEELEKIYNFFDLSVSLNLQSDSAVQKLDAYKADIMYATASTLGFDYLNDNMVLNYEDKFNKGERSFVLIDEVDLVLIDEARTPLIIGRAYPNPINDIKLAQSVVSQLSQDDFKVDFKHKTVALTEKGESRVAELYKIDSLFSEENIEKAHYTYQALVANFAFREDIDYALEKENGELSVVIIDAFTGRLQFGRRFSKGLHQALEAKHAKNGVNIKEENRTVATITLQNFFRLYNKISGMSGTAKEEKDEFMEVYGLPVVQIDTNKPVIREDLPAIIFDSMEDKWNYVVERIKHYNSEGKPILVGTVSLEDSLVLSSKLESAQLEHQVLNARQDAQEAAIISKAGEPGNITVATNMAGRGTDIKVDSSTQLVVISTELNESTRIDNQLKGRTSRQGAPGTTETILSADDRIFERTALSDKIRHIAKYTGRDNAALHKIIRSVQDELESAAFGGRKYSLRYDDIIREQRKVFYGARDKILTETNGEKAIEYLNKLTGEDLTSKVNSLTDNREDLALVFVRKLLLQAMDMAWVHQVDRLERLKGAIGWRGQNGQNPIIIFQNEAQELYNNFIKEIQSHIQNLITPLKYHTDLETHSSYYTVNNEKKTRRIG